MRKTLLVLVACTSAMLYFSCKKKDAETAPAQETVTPKTYQTLDGKQPLVIGHRGTAGSRPDHTIAGYLLTIEQKADFVEPDLVMTKDSVLICRHEPMLSGTTDVVNHPEFASYKTKKLLDGDSITDWFACDFTLAEIKTLRAIQPLSDAKNNRSKAYDGLFSIPTFQEVIELVKSESFSRGRTVGIYPETKHPTFHEVRHLHITDKALELLEKAGWNHKDAPVYLQSFEVSNLVHARSKSTIKLVQLYDAYDVDASGNMVMQAPNGQPYDFVVAGDARTYNDLATNAGLDFVKTYANGIGPWKPFIRPYSTDFKKLPATDLIQRAHARGLVVHAYTFRDEAYRLLKDYNGDPKAEYLDFFDLGVDGVFTDFTATAISARDN